MHASPPKAHLASHKTIWHSSPLLFARGREDAGRECFRPSVRHPEAWPSADSNCWLKAAVTGSPLLFSTCHRLQFYLLKLNSRLIIISCFSSWLTFKEMHRNLIISFLLFVLPAPYAPFNILAKLHHSLWRAIRTFQGHSGNLLLTSCSPSFFSGFVQDPFFLHHTTYRLHMFWGKEQLIIWFCDALK